MVDPGFEVNDLGFQFRGDQINSHVMFGHKWTRPSRLFRSWRLNMAGFRSYNYGGDVTWTGLFLTGLYELRNFSTGRGVPRQSVPAGMGGQLDRVGGTGVEAGSPGVPPARTAG